MGGKKCNACRLNDTVDGSCSHCGSDELGTADGRAERAEAERDEALAVAKRLRDIARSNQTAYERAAEDRATVEAERDAALVALRVERSRYEGRGLRVQELGHRQGLDFALSLLTSPATVPTTIEARALSGEHMLRKVRLSDGTVGVLCNRRVGVSLAEPPWFIELTPSAVVEFVDGGE